jgi:hypothetical protein
MRQQVAESGNHFFEGESGRARAGGEFTCHLGKLTLAFDGLFLWLSIADECSRALMGFQQASKFQFAVRAHDGIGVDGKINGELANGRKLMASGQGSGGNPSSNLIDELTVHGDAGVEIEDEFEPAVLGKLPHVN